MTHEQFMARHHKRCTFVLSVILWSQLSGLVIIVALVAPYIALFIIGCAGVWGLLSGLQMPAEKEG